MQSLSNLIPFTEYDGDFGENCIYQILQCLQHMDDILCVMQIMHMISKINIHRNLRCVQNMEVNFHVLHLVHILVNDIFHKFMRYLLNRHRLFPRSSYSAVLTLVLLPPFWHKCKKDVVLLHYICTIPRLNLVCIRSSIKSCRTAPGYLSHFFIHCIIPLVLLHILRVFCRSCLDLVVCVLHFVQFSILILRSMYNAMYLIYFHSAATARHE